MLSESTTQELKELLNLPKFKDRVSKIKAELKARDYRNNN